MSVQHEFPNIHTFPMAAQQGENYYAPPAEDENGDAVGRSVVTVDRDPEALFALWSDLKSIPRWQEYVVSVTPINENVSHWVMGNPEEEDGKRIEFDSAITETIPGAKIAWNSITEGIHQSGVVTFEETARGTRVRLTQVLGIPGGSLGIRGRNERGI